jgi:hypothetical protein
MAGLIIGHYQRPVGKRFSGDIVRPITKNPNPTGNAGSSPAAAQPQQQGNPGSYYAQQDEWGGPGRARPIPPQSQGTPYNPQQGQNFAGFGSQQGGAFSAWNPNIANNTQAQRPPAFQSQTNNFDGTQSQMPNFQQRDAFISQINNQLGQMQGQSWNQPVGAPQFNFPQMWGQAGQMVQQGFQNPFAAQPGGLPTQPGSRADGGPVPGTTMFPPPMPPTTANQGQPGQRTPITRAPAPRPGGITQDQVMQRELGDFWNQAQQMFPTMSPGQQQEMARFMKNQQQSQNQAMIDQARQAGINQPNADQGQPQQPALSAEERRARDRERQLAQERRSAEQQQRNARKAAAKLPRPPGPPPQAFRPAARPDNFVNNMGRPR